MHETLKELSAELAVMHESLERAEVIERQLPTYLREIEADLDAATDRAEAAEHTAAGLRRALEETRKDLPTYCANPDCRADRCIDARKAHAKLDAALAASPDEHERRLKAEALRDLIAEADRRRGSIISMWGDVSAGDILGIAVEMADLMEAKNGKK